MSRHHKWSEIKHKRDSIVWKGTNIDEVERFATRANFGFIVGSNYHNFRWYHTLYSKLEVRVRWLPEWAPNDDPTVLEIYPDSDDIWDYDPPDYKPWHWTTARIGDRIYSDGTVERFQSH